MKDGIYCGLAVCASFVAVAMIFYPINPAIEAAIIEEAAITLNIPDHHPLGCAVEDEHGRQLKVTMYVSGERKQRCYYGNVK